MVHEVAPNLGEVVGVDHLVGDQAGDHRAVPLLCLRVDEAISQGGLVPLRFPVPFAGGETLVIQAAPAAVFNPLPAGGGAVADVEVGVGIAGPPALAIVGDRRVDTDSVRCRLVLDRGAVGDGTAHQLD